MTILAKILIGTAGLAMVAGAAAPAAAQSYPYGSGYGNSGGVVGQVINQVLGGGQYGNQGYGQYGQGNDRIAVDQCTRAAQARVSRTAYNGYNQGYGNNGYNNAGAARVVGITSVERKSNGLKVSGVIASGMAYNQGAYGNQGYYGNQAYAYNNQVADLRFSCRVDYRGRVTDVDIKRNNQAYNRGY